MFGRAMHCHAGTFSYTCAQMLVPGHTWLSCAQLEDDWLWINSITGWHAELLAGFPVVACVSLIGLVDVAMHEMCFAETGNYMVSTFAPLCFCCSLYSLVAAASAVYPCMLDLHITDVNLAHIRWPLTHLISGCVC